MKKTKRWGNGKSREVLVKLFERHTIKEKFSRKS